MSLLIKGMEMPKNHNHLTITIWSNGAASYGLYNREESLVDFRNVEVVPVPPHGDLIDRDAFLKKCEFVCTDDDEDIRAVRYSIIENTPTIIPAEEGET